MADRRNLVLGLGKTGVSVVRWLASRGESIVVNDSRALPPGTEAISALGNSIKCRFGGFDLSLLSEADQIVLSPGISRSEPIVCEAIERNIPVIGDIELFAQHHTAPVVAVTGTNGKSTVTTLVAEMVSAAGKVPYAGGNLGDPALDLLSRPRPDYYVIELSSYQLESTETLKPAAATVLNVTADHMDRYTDLAAYAAAKERVYRRAETGVVNEDDPIVSQMKIPDGERISFGLSGNSLDFTALNDWLIVRGEKVLPLSDIRIPGLHNIANALAALALGASIGLPVSAMTKALKEFRGLPHRMQLVAEHDGVRFVDDSKGTNVGATVAAVSGLEGPLVLVAGGDGKEQDFSPLKDAFAGKVRHAVLIGRDRELLARALRTVCSTEFAADMNDAVIAAARIARPGEIVLLSPACASLDMFRDYADRGDRFADAARRLSA